MGFPPIKTSWIYPSKGVRWLRKEYFDKRVELLDESAVSNETVTAVSAALNDKFDAIVPRFSGEIRMSADTTTDRLTDELKGKTAVLGTKVAETLTKMEAVFADAHATIDVANVHVDKVAAAVARLKETLPA